MKNDIENINKSLFEVFEQLKNDEIAIPKAKAMVEVSTAIIKNASVQLQAFKMSKGKLAAPKILMKEEMYAILDSGDTYSKKTEYAHSLGYKDVTEAIGALGAYDFNKKYKELYS